MRLLQPLSMVPFNRQVYEGEYDCKALHNWVALADPGRTLTALDIGAHVGAWGASLLSLERKNIYIAYEPQVRLHVPINLARPDVQLHGQCVSTVGGTSSLVRRPGGGAGEYLLLPAGKEVPEGWDCLPVEVVPASSLPPCDLLKMDCEGAEADILENYPHLGSAHYVVYEWHSAELGRRCAQALLNACFKQVKVRLYPYGMGVAGWLRT